MLEPLWVPGSAATCSPRSTSKLPRVDTVLRTSTVLHQRSGVAKASALLLGFIHNCTMQCAGFPASVTALPSLGATVKVNKEAWQLQCSHPAPASYASLFSTPRLPLLLLLLELFDLGSLAVM